MARDKADIIKTICDGVDGGDDATVAAALREYPFVPQANAGRNYTELQATRIFVRDGFVDRYSGARLVHPTILRVLSKLLPHDFPFHPNWKMTDTHPAYWELVPTVDHIVPIARGGADPREIGWPRQYCATPQRRIGRLRNSGGSSFHRVISLGSDMSFSGTRQPARLRS